MFFKPLPVQVSVPEALYLIRDFRVNAVIICEDAICLGRHLIKLFSHAFHMGLKLLIRKTVQVSFHESCHLSDRLLDAVKIVVKISLAGLAQKQEQLIRLPLFRAANEEHREQSHAGNYQDHHAHCQQCHSCS